MSDSFPKDGEQIAFFFDMPDEKGGPEWYIGTVLRVSKGVWVDVNFDDGKAWCKLEETERGQRWVALK